MKQKNKITQIKRHPKTFKFLKLTQLGMKLLLDDEELEKLSSGNFQSVFSNAEIAMVFFRTDAEITERVIPDPLKPSPDPIAAVFIAKYPKTNTGSVYNEAALTLIVEHEGEVGSYCLSMPVTEDMACIRGRERFGFPKKIADEISLEKTENSVRGRCIRKGTELIDLSLPFEEEVEEEELIEIMNNFTSGKPEDDGWKTASYNFKYFFNPKMNSFDYKPRLIKQVTNFKPSGKVRLSYDFNLKLRSSNYDYLGEIPVEEPLLGFHSTFNNTMEPGEVVAEVEDEREFMRYIVHKFDTLSGVRL